MPSVQIVLWLIVIAHVTCDSSLPCLDHHRSSPTHMRHTWHAFHNPPLSDMQVARTRRQLAWRRVCAKASFPRHNKRRQKTPKRATRDTGAVSMLLSTAKCKLLECCWTFNATISVCAGIFAWCFATKYQQNRKITECGRKT